MCISVRKTAKNQKFCIHQGFLCVLSLICIFSYTMCIASVIIRLVLLKYFPQNCLLSLKMKAIITNNKRNQLYEGPIQFEQIKNFISKEFPRMNQPTINYANKKGEQIKIESDAELNQLINEFDGQNFVQISLGGNKKQCHHRKHEKSQKKDWKGNKEKFLKETKGEKPNKSQAERRCHVLAKIFGQTPEQYIQFEEENREVKMGQLIKKYAEVNGITNEKVKKENFKNKSERRTKILSKVFKGEPTDFVKFEEENKDLKIGKLLKKYAEVNEINLENVEVMKNRRVKKDQVKVQKLARFFSKPEEQYTEFVKEHPTLCFKRLLKEMGVEITREQLQEFRKGEKQRRREMRGKGEEKKERSERKERRERKQKKSRSERKRKEHSKQRVENPKSQNARKKGKILLKMKELFGDENGRAYFKFIEENIQLGEEGIVQKWLQTKN